MGYKVRVRSGLCKGFIIFQRLNLIINSFFFFFRYYDVWYQVPGSCFCVHDSILLLFIHLHFIMFPRLGIGLLLLVYDACRNAVIGATPMIASASFTRTTAGATQRS